MNHSDRFADHHLSAAQQQGEDRRLIEEGLSDEAPVATYYRDMSPLPAIGDTPPVPQPGRPAMSQRATDISGVTLATGFASVPLGFSVWIVGQVDPVIVGFVCVAPVAFLGALSRVLKRAKDVAAAAPPTHHHHYEGTVVQDHSRYSTETRGLIARTRNELRR